jgi:hypothetical protein
MPPSIIRESFSLSGAVDCQKFLLEEQARQAWEDYLSRDSASGWASEARIRLQKLQQSQPGDLARNHSPPAIDDAAVEAALDWLI